MEPILQSDIDILVLRHLAAYSCTETARCLIKEKPELRFYVQMQMSSNKSHLLGGCTPATDSIQKLKGTQLVHASLRDVIMEFFYAKSIVKQMIERIIFEWQALRFDDVGLLDSMTTHLKSISKLLEKLWKEQEKPDSNDACTCTSEDNILPMYPTKRISTADVEIQTVEEEDEAVQLMFYNNLLINTNFQEKIADSINEQLANSQTTRNEENVVKKVCSKTESEIDAFLREMLHDNTDTDGTECDVGSPHGAKEDADVEISEEVFVNVEQNLKSLFSDAESLIHSNKSSLPAVSSQACNSQKRQFDLVEMLTTPKKIEITPPNVLNVIRNDRKSSVTPVCLKETFISPDGQTYSVRKLSGGLSEWNKLGRRSIAPNIPVPVSTYKSVSTNKRKAKLATPLKLTTVNAVTSSQQPNCVSVTKTEAVTVTSNFKTSNAKVGLKTPCLEVGEIEVDKDIEILPPPQTPSGSKKLPVFVPITPLSNPSPVIMKPPQHFTPLPCSLTNSPSSSFVRVPLTRPVGPAGLQTNISPIKIFRSTPRPSLQHMPILSPLVTKSLGEQTPIVIADSPKVSSQNNVTLPKPIYSPITPSSIKSTLPSSSTMSPFLRKLVASAQKVKSVTVADIPKPNKKSYSTPRKKNFVRNLQFKTPPSLGKEANDKSQNASTLNKSNVESQLGEGSILPLPKIRSKKRLEWSENLPESDNCKKAPVKMETAHTMNIISIQDIASKLIKDKSENKPVVQNSIKPPELSQLQPAAEMLTPKLLIKNRNTVISVSVPKAALPSPSLTIISGPIVVDTPEVSLPTKTNADTVTTPREVMPPPLHSDSHKKSDILKRKKSVTPPSPPAKKSRKSKRVKEAEAAKSEACNAVAVGKGPGRGRGRTPKKKHSGVKSPLRNILPKPVSGSDLDVSPELPNLQKASNTIVNSSSNFIIVPQNQFPSFSNILPTTSSKVPKVTVIPALVTPVATPLKNNISPEALGLPPTPRACVVSVSNESDVEPTQRLKLTYQCDTPFKNISQFFSTPLKSGNPITPGKPDNPILIDEGSQSCSRDSIFDTPDKEHHLKPFVLPSPFPLLKAAINSSNNLPSVSDKSKDSVKIVKPSNSIIKTGFKDKKSLKNPTFKFKVSGREKELTMSEHETVLGLLHMSEGIGSSHSKMPVIPNTTEAATPTKDVQQLLQNANLEAFLQNFVSYNKK